MRQENFASNYDIFTGKVKLQTYTLDEMHTGSLWEQARQKYCGDDPYAFPLALVCFYDKTNTDDWFSFCVVQYSMVVLLQ